ncbi:MAG: DNA double-strand break repair nuclease NurA [archaeon]|nr:DNA double-strand break repair nuclease NurA [archaeon]
MGKQLNLPINEKILPDTSLIAESITKKLFHKFTSCTLKLTKKRIIFNTDNSNMKPIGGWPSSEEIEVREFSTISQPTVLAALDSSCIHIADVEDGSIYAARVTSVFFYDQKPQNHVRIGPIILYLNEQNLIDEEYGDERLSRLVLLDDSLAKSMIRIRLERAFAMELVRNLSRGIIMIDGSLRSSIFDLEDSSLVDILDTAKRNDNRVIGVSKSSRHRILNKLSGRLHSTGKAPLYSDIHQLVSPIFKGVQGRVLLVKFTNDGLVFRVDISKFDDRFDDTLSRVRHNDCFFRGYPESLRLAHHLSIFTGSEDTSIKSYILKKFSVIELPAEDPRKIALGSLKIKSLRKGAFK